jgi:hypothetical protein
MFIDSAGNVGIGTDSPDTKLTIEGDSPIINIRNTAETESGINFVDTASPAQSARIMYDSGASNALIFYNNAIAERMRIDSSGNVGIGTTPNAWATAGGTKALQISTRSALWEAYNGVYLTNNMYYDGSEKYIESDEAGAIVIGGDGSIYFQNAVSGTAGGALTWNERMRITSGGDVLIGTQGIPNGTSIYGSAFRTNSNGRMTLNMATSNSGAQGHIEFYNPNGLVGSITTSGSATAYNTSSDYRLKENVVPMEGALDRVDALKPSRFNFIADPEKTVDGFLAHEVAEVIPEAISGEKDAVEEYEVTPAVLDEEGNIIEEAVMGTRPIYQGIDQSKIVPLLVGAIKELKAEIESLKSQLNA